MSPTGEAHRVDPIRIVCVLTELIGGGAERSMLSIIDALDRTRFAPHLVLFTDRMDHAPPAGVPITVMKRRSRSAVVRLVARVFELRRLIARERIELVVSFLVGPNIVSVAAARLAGTPVVIGERSAPRVVLSRANQQLANPRFWSALARLLYPRASGIVTNTEGARRELTEFFGVRAERVHVVPNAVDIDRILSLGAEPADRPWPEGDVLVHVGRFTYAKDHDTLLDAFAILAAQRPITLVLVGDGEDELRIRARCSTLRLDDRVVFIGFSRNPYKYLARATICVLTSRFEGLPNILIEAMALGIPIVSTACEHGPVELLGDSEYGVLTPVGDAAGFARAVAGLLDDRGRRSDLSRRGTIRARDFDHRRVRGNYEELFERMARTRPGRLAVKSSHATSK
jgi:glycosyltransferase involved in cell wall biosynthesis